MNSRRAYPFGIVLVILAALFGLCFGTSAAQNVPDARLRVTVQQKEGGRLNRDLHFQELFCWRGDCSLTTVTLNSCRPSPVSQGKASPVVIERASTREGSLAVTNEGDTLVVIETGADIGGRYVTTQRFRYEKPRAGEMALRLIGYSGGFVKNSAIAQQVLTVEFIPFRGAYREASLIALLASLVWTLLSSDWQARRTTASSRRPSAAADTGR